MNMHLARNTFMQIDTAAVILPQEKHFFLPEKILQFGTGVLLRGLPDYFIDKANKQNIFNGRVVVVKSTATAGADSFEQQNSLFTHCIRGIENGELRDDYIMNAAISRVLTAATEWNKILELATQETMQIVISNTTEAGLILNESERINEGVPKSFPGKLLAFLYARWKHFSGEAGAGMVILPTELIPNNGTLLKDILHKLSVINQLEPTFIEWLCTENNICNTLVDRIVPGKLPSDLQQKTVELLGYTDDLMIMSEPFALWAIETSNEEVIKKLSFAKVDAGIIIAPSIAKFRELKLRLLNGTHTFSCALAFLSGFETVIEAMKSEQFVSYSRNLMQAEISPCLLSDEISHKDALSFANEVIERFQNPFIEHRWISITLNFTEKMRMRNIPLLLKHYQLFRTVPIGMTMGFAAYLFFMRSAIENNGVFSGMANEQTYLIDDIKAPIFIQRAKHASVAQYVQSILSDHNLWGTNLSLLGTFEADVITYLEAFDLRGVKDFFMNFHSTKEKVA